MKSQTDTFSSICLHEVVSRKIVSWSRVHHINHNLRWKKNNENQMGCATVRPTWKIYHLQISRRNPYQCPCRYQLWTSVCLFYHIGRKTSKEILKNYSTIIKKRKKSKKTNKRHSNLGGNKYWGSLIKNCQSFRLRQTWASRFFSFGSKTWW